MITTSEERRAAARTINNEPTETEQSSASETDLNVILKRYLQSGTVTGHGKEPMYEDWTEYPEDLRGFIEHARSAAKLRKQLPKELQGYSLEDLVKLTPDELTRILTPPAPPPDKPAEPPKETPK